MIAVGQPGSQVIQYPRPESDAWTGKRSRLNPVRQFMIKGWISLSLTTYPHANPTFRFRDSGFNRGALWSLCMKPNDKMPI
jgi:hypothetical protein